MGTRVAAGTDPITIPFLDARCSPARAGTIAVAFFVLDQSEHESLVTLPPEFT